jgi:FtsZ-binding cell division protein ZapB
MPPKNSKKPVPSDSGDEDSLKDMIRDMAAQLSSLNQKMDKIDSIESEVKGLKILLNDLKSENKQLKTEAREAERKLSDMNVKNNALENRINNLEQYNRSWSARAMNIPLTEQEESDNSAVAAKVYDLLLLPILNGAVERKLLQSVPTVDQILETAHILPGKAGHPKPVIMRFFNRNVKETIFKLKKFYSPREGTRNTGGGGPGGGRGGGRAASGGAVGGTAAEEDGGGFEGRGRYLYPLYEDLSRASFQKMKSIANDSRVKACWSVKGHIKFTLVKSPNEVRRVVSLLDPLEDILK